MNIYLATWLEDNQGKTLTKAGSDKRLLSYYFLRETPKGFLEKYINQGNPERKSE